MSDTYKVRMTVLVLMKGDDPNDAAREGVNMAEDAGLTVLHVDEPEKVVSPLVHRDTDDIYP